MVARGILGRIWLDLPDEDEENLYKKEFLQIFGASWEQLMVGAANPFAYHLPWDGYFAVRDLKVCHGLTLLDLPLADDKGGRRYNIFVG